MVKSRTAHGPMTADTSEIRARHETPVFVSLGLRAAAVTDLFASLARLLSPVLDVLIRLWLAEGFLVTDVMQHMLGDQTTVSNHLPPSALLFASLAATGFGIFLQTICPVLLAAGLFTRLAALALLCRCLSCKCPGTRNWRPTRWRCSGGSLCSGRGRSRLTACSALASVPRRCLSLALSAGAWQASPGTSDPSTCFCCGCGSRRGLRPLPWVERKA